VLPRQSNTATCPIVEPHHHFKAVKYKYHQSCAGEKVLALPVGSLPVPRWDQGPLSVPCRLDTPCIRLKSSITAPHSTPNRERLPCHRVPPQLHTRSHCRRALASPCAPWHRARHPIGKSSTITICPTTADPSSIVGGLWRCHVPRATGPATLHGRASVSPHVPRHQTRLLVWECSGVIMCPMALGPLPGREGLRCHHMSCGSRPTSRCGGP
jgi:hypothetical protein